MQIFKRSEMNILLVNGLMKVIWLVPLWKDGLVLENGLVWVQNTKWEPGWQRLNFNFLFWLGESLETSVIDASVFAFVELIQIFF